MIGWSTIQIEGNCKLGPIILSIQKVYCKQIIDGNLAQVNKRTMVFSYHIIPNIIFENY